MYEVTEKFFKRSSELVFLTVKKMKTKHRSTHSTEDRKSKERKTIRERKKDKKRNK